MKLCGKCGYWGGQCYINPNPVGGRTETSIGCKFHNGPEEPIDGQLSFSAEKIFLLDLCNTCKGNPAGTNCNFELVPDEETGEAIGVKCTNHQHADQLTAEEPGSICSRCANDPTNGGEAPCGGEVDDIDGTCFKFAIAEGAWPCGECGHRLNDDCPCTGPAADGLCDELIEIPAPIEEVDDVDADVNQLCRPCLLWWKNFDGAGLEPGEARCPGKDDGSVECDDFKDIPEAATELSL